MADAAGFTKRIAGPNNIRWSLADIARLAKIYGLTEKQAIEIVQQQRERQPQLLRGNKSAATDGLPVKWRFTASDGKVDRVGDIIAIEGIRLGDFLANPIWHYAHDYDLPVGMAPETYKLGGKLKSVLQLGIGIFPYADTLQRALATGMCRACSVGFDPIRWSYNKARDGIDFEEISLREISAVTVPCCAGAVLEGPVKAGSEAERKESERRKRQRKVDLIKVMLGP